MPEPETHAKLMPKLETRAKPMSEFKIHAQSQKPEPMPEFKLKLKICAKPVPKLCTNQKSMQNPHPLAERAGMDTTLKKWVTKKRALLTLLSQMGKSTLGTVDLICQ